MMAVDGVLVTMVRDELRRISDTGALASRAQLREAVGIGAGDLETTLAQLREAGEASEVEPDGYRLVTGPEELDSDAARAGRAGADDGGEEPERGPAAGLQLRAADVAGDPADVFVQLDAAVAAVLDAGSLGKIVEAGIGKAAERGAGFVFEVRP